MISLNFVGTFSRARLRKSNPNSARSRSWHLKYIYLKFYRIPFNPTKFLVVYKATLSSYKGTLQRFLWADILEDTPAHFVI